MSFQVSPLPASRFQHLYGRSDAELRSAGIVAQTADGPGYPCRVTLRDAKPGERLLLMNYEHQSAATPFRSSHAIYVIDGADTAAPKRDEVPGQLASRMLSVRAFSEDGMIVGADVVDGSLAAPLFERLLDDKRVAYLHAHFAKYGCYAARIDRA
jgi:hypothetical protein